MYISAHSWASGTPLHGVLERVAGLLECVEADFRVAHSAALTTAGIDAQGKPLHVQKGYVLDMAYSQQESSQVHNCVCERLFDYEAVFDPL